VDDRSITIKLDTLGLKCMKTYCTSAIRERSQVNGTLNNANNFNHTLGQMTAVQSIDNSVHSNKKIQRDRTLYRRNED